MTEIEWLTCTDPKKMLKVLRGKNKASDRKLRLLACGCCRRIWEDLTLKPLRPAIEAAEQYADLSVTIQELEGVHHKSVSALARSLHRTVGKRRNDTAYATKMCRMCIAANAVYPAPFQIKLLHGLGEDEFLCVFSPVLLSSLRRRQPLPACHHQPRLAHRHSDQPRPNRLRRAYLALGRTRPRPPRRPLRRPGGSRVC